MEKVWIIWQLGYVLLLWRRMMERFIQPTKPSIMWLKWLLCNAKVKIVISQDENNDHIFWWSVFVVNYLKKCIYLILVFISLYKIGKYKILLQVLSYGIFINQKLMHAYILGQFSLIVYAYHYFGPLRINSWNYKTLLLPI